MEERVSQHAYGRAASGSLVLMHQMPTPASRRPCSIYAQKQNKPAVAESRSERHALMYWALLELSSGQLSFDARSRHL
jgi:hypothetical protein